MLRPLATSCAKNYKGHSLMQTSFTEPPNRHGIYINVSAWNEYDHRVKIYLYILWLYILIYANAWLCLDGHCVQCILCNFLPVYIFCSKLKHQNMHSSDLCSNFEHGCRRPQEFYLPLILDCLSIVHRLYPQSQASWTCSQTALTASTLSTVQAFVSSSIIC